MASSDTVNNDPPLQAVGKRDRSLSTSASSRAPNARRKISQLLAFWEHQGHTFGKLTGLATHRQGPLLITLTEQSDGRDEAVPTDTMSLDVGSPKSANGLSSHSVTSEAPAPTQNQEEPVNKREPRMPTKMTSFKKSLFSVIRGKGSSPKHAMQQPFAIEVIADGVALHDPPPVTRADTEDVESQSEAPEARDANVLVEPPVLADSTVDGQPGSPCSTRVVHHSRGSTRMMSNAMDALGGASFEEGVLGEDGASARTRGTQSLSRQPSSMETVPEDEVRDGAQDLSRQEGRLEDNIATLEQAGSGAGQPNQAEDCWLTGELDNDSARCGLLPLDIMTDKLPELDPPVDRASQDIMTNNLPELEPPVAITPQGNQPLPDIQEEADTASPPSAQDNAMENEHNGDPQAVPDQGELHQRSLESARQVSPTVPPPPSLAAVHPGHGAMSFTPSVQRDAVATLVAAGLLCEGDTVCFMSKGRAVNMAVIRGNKLQCQRCTRLENPVQFVTCAGIPLRRPLGHIIHVPSSTTLRDLLDGEAKRLLLLARGMDAAPPGTPQRTSSPEHAALVEGQAEWLAEELEVLTHCLQTQRQSHNSNPSPEGMQHISSDRNVIDEHGIDPLPEAMVLAGGLKPLLVERMTNMHSPHQGSSTRRDLLSVGSPLSNMSTLSRQSSHVSSLDPPLPRLLVSHSPHSSPLNPHHYPRRNSQSKTGSDASRDTAHDTPTESVAATSENSTPASGLAGERVTAVNVNTLSAGSVPFVMSAHSSPGTHKALQPEVTCPPPSTPTLPVTPPLPTAHIGPPCNASSTSRRQCFRSMSKESREAVIAESASVPQFFALGVHGAAGRRGADWVHSRGTSDSESIRGFLDDALPGEVTPLSPPAGSPVNHRSDGQAMSTTSEATLADMQQSMTTSRTSTPRTAAAPKQEAAVSSRLLKPKLVNDAQQPLNASQNASAVHSTAIFHTAIGSFSDTPCTQQDKLTQSSSENEARSEACNKEHAVTAVHNSNDEHGNIGGGSREGPGSRPYPPLYDSDVQLMHAEDGPLESAVWSNEGGQMDGQQRRSRIPSASLTTRYLSFDTQLPGIPDVQDETEASVGTQELHVDEGITDEPLEGSPEAPPQGSLDGDAYVDDGRLAPVNYDPLLSPGWTTTRKWTIQQPAQDTCSAMLESEEFDDVFVQNV